MNQDVKVEDVPTEPYDTPSATTPKTKGNAASKDPNASSKRRCVSTACIACRRRKSKCDGNLPKCAACASVYLTECEYAPHTDHRRKGVYKKEADSLKSKTSTLQTLIHALLNYEEDDAVDLLKQMRTADNLEELVQMVDARNKGTEQDIPDSPVYRDEPAELPKFDAELSGKMGDLLLDGSVKFIGGTSNLVWLDDMDNNAPSPGPSERNVVHPREDALLSWTAVHHDKDLILHFLNMYFCWHYPYFTTLSKELFYRDFLTGTSSQYCSAILVNAMLALGCHFSSKPAARADPEDSGTTGDHYFAEAKRLLYENEEFANTKLCTVQALAIMSVREAGCGRESKGWVYSGMSFRMASDLGLNVDAPAMNDNSKLSDEDIDARRITFWGCFLFDKCWSNYLGRQPQLQLAHTNTKKYEVFPSEDSELWSPYTDAGIVQANAQPARTRAVALQILKLAEISSDLLVSFYQPGLLEKPLTKQAELKKLTDIHTRLEAWKRDLPVEFEPKDGQLPPVLLMHMFFQLLYIHLYRPFLRFTKATSPLPVHISPRKFCTQAASAISKLLRLYKRTHGLRQIINKVVYIAHSACTIHLLNLPDKNAKRDIVHGLKQLEEMGECWTAARRTLRILHLCAERWRIVLPEEAQASFARAQVRWGSVESTAGPVSPDTLANMTQQITARPVPDLMAQNIQQQQPPQLPTTVTAHHFTTEQMAGLTAYMAPSPAETIDTRRSSGNYSLPPHSAADLTRNSGRIRQSTQLTKEQQDAWNALQARMSVPSQQQAARQAATGANASAQSLFGGVESLIGESQEWWYNDQNQLAQGFVNWTAPDPDWAHMNGMDVGMVDNMNSLSSLPNVAANGLFAHQSSTLSNGYQALINQASQQRDEDHGTLSEVNGHYQQQRQQHNLYQTAQLKRQLNWADENLYS
ncbi:hypothetical protein LTR64_002720 [Lithohypha guttulata]|uniref:uncharacterized protein n=1 Tax=Lithohypha guttulata TaxID=1690604 RepID=UPI002DDDE17A|nr:hypothetical protein LTR51_001056 [Lithohypha guttulata]